MPRKNKPKAIKLLKPSIPMDPAMFEKINAMREPRETFASVARALLREAILARAA